MILGVLKKVFENNRYKYIAGVISVLVLSFVLLLPNRELIAQVMGSDSLGLGDKLSFTFGLYEVAFTNFTIWSLMFMLSLAILFGVNLALLTYYIKNRQTGQIGKVGQFTSIAGFVSGLFGIGCAACGSIIITSILTAVGAGGLLLLLPYKGAEFSVLGVVLLIYSNYYLIKKINDPLICPSN